MHWTLGLLGSFVYYWHILLLCLYRLWCFFFFFFFYLRAILEMTLSNSILIEPVFAISRFLKNTSLCSIFIHVLCLLKKILIRYLASCVSYYIKTIWKLERLYYLPVVLGDTVFRPRHSSSGGCVFTTRLSCLSAQGALRGILLLCEHTGDPQHQHLLHGRCFITFVCKLKN